VTELLRWHSVAPLGAFNTACLSTD
jgi:hypothetical protein